MKSLAQFNSQHGYFGLRPFITVIWHATFKARHETLKVDLVWWGPVEFEFQQPACIGKLEQLALKLWDVEVVYEEGDLGAKARVKPAPNTYTVVRLATKLTRLPK